MSEIETNHQQSLTGLAMSLYAAEQCKFHCKSNVSIVLTTPVLGHLEHIGCSSIHVTGFLQL